MNGRKESILVVVSVALVSVVVISTLLLNDDIRQYAFGTEEFSLRSVFEIIP